MSVTASWYNPEKTIIRLAYVSPWTWDEFVVATKQALEIGRTAEHNVGIISQPSVPLPKGNPLPYFAESLKDLPDNVRLIVIVSSNYFTNSLTRLGVTVLSKERDKISIVYSLPEAEAAIARKISAT